MLIAAVTAIFCTFARLLSAIATQKGPPPSAFGSGLTEGETKR